MKNQYVFTKDMGLLLSLAVSFLVIFHSCTLPFSKVECRDFSYYSSLSWYPGFVGDTVTFVKQDNTKIDFIIKNKYIYHIPDYISDSGCGCYDCFGMMMIHHNDTIDMFGEGSYIYDHIANRNNCLYIKMDGVLTGFVGEDASIIKSYTIDSISFTNVLRYKYTYTENAKFKEIYIAERIGIIKMVRNNGEIWINENLTQPLNADFDTFSYEEIECN